MSTQKHIWNFSSVGGVKRVNLERGNDLLALDQLDQKLWTALSCPVHGLEIDAKTLQLIDTDNDGQIRVPEVLAAVKWVLSVIKNPDDLLKQSTVFPLDAINEHSGLGKALLSSAQIILKNLNKPDATTLTVEETSDVNAIFANSVFNGDGVIIADCTSDESLKTLIAEVMFCMGEMPDRSGKMGVNAELIAAFFDACTQQANWLNVAETNKQQILPLGDKTALAYEAFEQVESKISDYFIRCKMIGFEELAANLLSPLASQLEAVSTGNMETHIDEVALFPIAKINVAQNLPLQQHINPAWEDKLQQFVNLVYLPVFKQGNILTYEQWCQIKDLVNPYKTWLSEQQGKSVAKLGIDRINQILKENKQQQLLDLVAQDVDLADEAESIILVDQLVRYYRDLFTLLKNFVTFYDFYSSENKAIFLAGTLYIDQRSCDLCIKVNNMDKHAGMVGLSGMYLLYCECVSRSTNETMTIVAALTNGDIDNLMVGRNALFYDRNGLDWDATIIKIIDNPISIKQAFWSPYRKVSRFIESQVNKFASAEENKVTENTTKNIETLPAKIEAPKQPPTPFDVGKFVGIFAAIGLALGAIGTAIASFVAGFMGLVWWKMPIAIAGLLLVISGPSMIIAYLKLRKRNLAPILDANGWAINARAIVNIQFGNTLTQLASLPEGAKVNLNDPFTKKGRPVWQTIFMLAVLIGGLAYLLWRLKFLHL